MIVVSTVQAATAPTVRSSDVRFDTYRASGPGGQHRNKTDSAVRATHTPTGVVVTATESRSQHANRQLAWDRLVAAVQAEHIAQQTSTAAADKAAVFAGRREWTWCGWRDEVVSPNGRRASMRHALSGRFGRTVG